MRAVAIDSLRGLCLVMMTFDHLLITPFNSWNKVYLHAYGPFGFFSAAEIFFFISGLLVGSIIAEKPNATFTHRVKKIYFSNAAILLLLVFIMHIFPDYFLAWYKEGSLKPFVDSPLVATVSFLSFVYLPFFFDVLPLYCVFFLFIPLIRKAIDNQKISFLIFFSGLSWIIGQFFPSQIIENNLKSLIPSQFFYFEPWSWQALFLIALLAGYFYKKIPNHKFFSPNRNMILFMVAFCVICFSVRHYYAGETNFINSLTEVRTLGPLRFINFLFAAMLCFTVLKRVKIPMNPFAYLGKMSLTVFLYHAFLVYLVSAPSEFIAELTDAQKTIVVLLSLLSLWLPVAIKYIYKRIAEKLTTNLTKEEKIGT